MSRIRTALGLLLSVSLLVVIAGLGLFLTRDSILWPLAAREAPKLIRDAVGLSLEVRSIEGDAVHGLRLRGVSVGPGADLPTIPRIEGLDVDLAYDARALLAGDFEGLRAVRAHARRVDVVLGGATPSEDEAAEPFDPWGLGDAVPGFFGMLPDGAVLQVDELSIHADDGAVLGSGPARVQLTPRPRRRVLVTWSDALGLELLLTRDGLFHVEATAADPMQRLRALGIEVPLEGGRVALSAEGDLAARDLGASVRWTGADLRERGASAFRAQVRVRGGFAQADAEADLPGVVVRAHDLGVSLADAATALEAARGSVEVRVTDLEPWRALVPEPVLPWLPISAELRASLDAEGLDVRAGGIHARGLEVTIDRGRLPLRVEGDVRRARGSVEARIEAPAPVRFDIAGEEVRFAGSAVVGVDGTLDEPTVRARLGLRDVLAFGHAVAGLDATVRADRTSLQVEEAVVRGARPEAVERGVDAEFRGTLRSTPPALAVRTELHAVGGWPEILAEFAPAAGPYAHALADGGDLDLDVDLVFPDGADALPIGRAGVGFRAPSPSPTQLHAGITLAPAADGVGLELALDGDAAPELLASLVPDTPLAALPSPVGFAATATGQLVDLVPRDVTVLADVIGDGPEDGSPWRLGVAASLPSTDRVELHQLEVCGPLHVDLSGVIPLVDGAGELDLEIRTEVTDSAQLTPWIGTAIGGIELRARGSVRGALAAPSAALALDASTLDLRPLLGDARGFDQALPAGLRARLRASEGVVFVDEVDADVGADDEIAHLELRGRAPLRVDTAGLTPGQGLVRGALVARSSRVADTPISASIPIHWDERALWLPEIEVRTPLSKIDGQLRVADPTSVLRGVPPADLGVEGSLELWQFDVTRLPAALLPPPVLAGVVDAVLSVEGSLGAPGFAGIVTVAGGRAKVANDVPTIDAIEAQLDLARDTLSITRLEAAVGSGRVTAHGTVSSGDAPTLLQAGDSLVIDVALEAREAVFLRGTGKSLRADSDITVKGTPARVDIVGEVVVLSGTIINRISLVPDFATRGGAPVGAGLKLFEIPPPLGDALRFDIAVRTEEPLDIVTHVFNAPMSASFSLQGSGAAPFLNGAVSATRGTLRLPAMTLDVRQALVTFLPEEPTRPRLLVRADTRRHGVDVSLTATGPADAPEVLLSSLPPLTQQELFVLISTGVLPETLQRQGLAGRATAVGSYLAEEIINFYFGSESTEAGESLADRIHVYSGREISRKGVESIVVDVDIWKGFALEGERDIYQDFNMGVLYRVRF